MRDFVRYFDAFFCLSMPSSQDRRQHIESHFGTLGIEGYEFFDAVGPDDPEVQELYASGRVAKYPPCFRCGELTCGSDDCNNVLIPAQVATCVSFQRLWRHILDRGIGTALIVEDDVIFTNYAPQVARVMLEQGFFDQIGLEEETPTLLRLGWTAGPDHQLKGQVSLGKDGVKMANHCFAVNRAMCQKLLDEFVRVETTADEYTHRVVGTTVRNFIIQPPIACDLSFSFGAMTSLIHPKKKRIAFLQKHHPERRDEITATIEAVRTHVKHILYRPILSIGHPECGSSYMSELFKACGLDVGHEMMGKDGISSWMFAVEDDENPWARDPLAVSRKHKYFAHVIHFVRNPVTAIPSIVREIRHAERSYAFRRRHIQDAFGVDLDTADSDVERALISYLYWNKLIEAQKVDLTLQVEDAEDGLFGFLKDQGLVAANDLPSDLPPKTVKADRYYQGKQTEEPNLSLEEWRSVGDGLQSEINRFCARYGYDALYE